LVQVPSLLNGNRRLETLHRKGKCDCRKHAATKRRIDDDSGDLV